MVKIKKFIKRITLPLVLIVLLVGINYFGNFNLFSFINIGASKDIFAVDEGSFAAPDGKTYQHKISGVIDLEGIPTPQGGVLTYRTQKTIFALPQDFDISSQPSRDYYFKINFECGTWRYTASCKGGYITLSLYKNNSLPKTTATGYWGYDTSGNYDRLTTAPTKGYIVSDSILFYPDSTFIYKEGGGSACCNVPITKTEVRPYTTDAGSRMNPTYTTVGRVLASSYSDFPIIIVWDDSDLKQQIAPVVVPVPIGFNTFLSLLTNWILAIFDAFSPLLSITGESNIKPDTEYTYNISVGVLTSLDADASDGSFAVRYGYIAVVDKKGNIVSDVLNGSRINNKLDYQFIYTTPMNLGDYAIVAIITETKATYQNGNWVWSPETIIAKESQLLQYERPMSPPGRGIIYFLSSVFIWLKSLFGWL